MRNSKLLLAAALVLGTPRITTSQNVGERLVNDVRDAGKDIVAVWVSPFRGSSRDWLLAGGALAGSALISVWDDNVDRFMVSHANASYWSPLKELRQGGIAFSGKTITPVVVGTYALGLVLNNRDIRDGVWGCVASYVSGSVVRNQVFYRAIFRERPDSARKHEVTALPAEQGDQYNFALGNEGWGGHSFPAGHVANIASCASFLTNRFSMGVVEPALWIVTAGVGVGRQVDRRHWTSDTVIGIIFGYAIGKEVARRSLERVAASRAPATMTGAMERGLYFAPTSRGLTLGWQATF
jgi:membrane-associated phospholipid phosphatase